MAKEESKKSASDDFLEGLSTKMSSMLTESINTAMQNLDLNELGKNLTNTITKGLNDVDVPKILEDKLLKDTKVKKIGEDLKKKVEENLSNLKIKVGNVEIPKQVIDVETKLKTKNLILPKTQLEVPVTYKIPKLNLSKVEDVKVPVKFDVPDKIKLPKADNIVAKVKFDVPNLELPKLEDVKVPVKFNVLDKIKLPKVDDILVNVKYKYSKLNIPEADALQIQVKYKYEKLQLPIVKNISIPVLYEYEKLVLPKNNSLIVDVAYQYKKLILPKVEDIVVSVGYKYNKLILPKADILQVQVKYVYDKLTLPKVDNINVDVSYNYQKLNLPKVDDLIAKVKFTVPKDIKLPKPKDIKVSVNFDVQKLTLPKADDIVAKVKFNVPKDIKLPKVNDILVKVVYQTEQLQLPSKLTLQAVVDKIDTTQAIQTLPIIELKAKLKNIETGEVGELKSMDVKATVTEVDTSLVKKQISDITPTIKLNISDGGTTKNISKDITGTVSAAKDFVNLIVEANKKSKITLDTYNQITSAATKLVQANKMSKAEVDGLLESLKSKLEQKDQVKIGVDTSAVNDIATELTDIKPNVKIKGAIHIDVNSIKSQIKKITPLSIDGILKLDTSELTNLKKENITIGAKLEIDTSESKKIQSTTTPIQQVTETAPTNVTINTDSAENLKSTIEEAKNNAEELSNIPIPGTAALANLKKFIEDFKKSNEFKRLDAQTRENLNTLFDKGLQSVEKRNRLEGDYVKSLQDGKILLSNLSEMQAAGNASIQELFDLYNAVNNSRSKTIDLSKEEGAAGEAARNLLVDEGRLLGDRVKALGFTGNLNEYIVSQLKEGVSLEEILQDQRFNTLLDQEKINKNAEYNNNLQKINNELAASAIVNSNDALRNLSEEGRQEAINIEMRGKALGYTRDQISEELKSLALKDAANEKAKEALFYSNSIAEAQRSYNKAVKQSDLGKLSAELSSQLGLIEDEVAAKATMLALENERVTGVRALLPEQIDLLKSEDGILNKKKEILKADQAILNHNKAIVESNKKIDLTTQTRQLTNQLHLLSEEAKLKAELLLQQKIANGEAAKLSEIEIKQLREADNRTVAANELLEALTKISTIQKEAYNLEQQSAYDIMTAEITNQLGLTEELAIQQAKALIQSKVANGEAAKLSEIEIDQIQAHNNLAKARREAVQAQQAITQATSEMNKELQNGELLSKALTSNAYQELGLTQQASKAKAQAIVLDGIRKGLSEDEIRNSLQGIKLEDSILQKTLERIQASKDLESATDDYAKAVRQADADINIKDLTRRLRLSEEEVSQQARLLALENERKIAAGELTDELAEQIKRNGGLTDIQIEQLKNDNKALRHKREQVELIEHVANYQKEITEEVENITKGYKKFGATLKAIATDRALAKGVFIASAMKGIHELTHAMHRFKEVGMSAGEAVSAKMKSMSLASVMGLSKSEDVVGSLATEYGNLNTLTDKQVDTVGKMAYNNGLAGQEATNLVMSMSRMPGMTRESATNSEKMFKEIGKAKGVIPAQIMKEMAKNTGLMATYSKGGAQGFAKAAAEAKRMGVELSSVLNAAEKTLDYESSLNSQMEASVLLGKEINLDRLRQAALSGDANAIMREQQNLMKQVGNMDNMNLIQKKALANAMGLSVEEMQKMTDEANFQNKYFGEQASTYQNIVGYVLKYGEGIGNLVTQFGPLAAAILSLILQGRTLNTIRKQSVITQNLDTNSTNANTVSTRMNAQQKMMVNKLVAQGIPPRQAIAAVKNIDTTATVQNTSATQANTLATRVSSVANNIWATTKRLGILLLRASGIAWVAETAYKIASSVATKAVAAAERGLHFVIGAGIMLRNSETVAAIKSAIAKRTSAAASTLSNIAEGVGNAIRRTSIGLWLAERLGIVASTAAKATAAGANYILSSSQTAVSTTAAPASAGLVAFGGALGAFATAAAGAAPILLALGAAVLMVGAGIGIAAYGMSLLVQSFAGLTGPQIVGAVVSLLMLNVAIVALAGTMFLLATSGAGPVAVGLLLAFGAAFLMIGGGVMMAASGFSTFTKSLKDVSGLASQLQLVATSIVQISKSLNQLALAGIKAIPALGVIRALSMAGGPTPITAATTTTPAPPTAKAITATTPITAATPIATGLGTTPTQPPTAVGGPPAPTPATPAATPAQTESGMNELIKEIRDLKQIIAKGGKIVMNAKEVGDALRLYGGFDTKAN